MGFTKGFCVFVRSQNLWDFAFNKKKNKTKQKDFAMS
jgi:hypothetical protein